MAGHLVMLCALSVALLPIIIAKDIGCGSDPKPNFEAPGRRISEEKCYEYNWEIKNIEKCSKDPANTQYPYMGMMGYKVKGKSEWSFRCHAFLISPKFALTVAHCIKNSLKSVPEIVRFGNSDIKNDVSRLDVKIVRTIVHPSYNPPNTDNDIALIELEEALPFTSSIQPVCLWQKSSLDGIQYGSAPGWGTDGKGNQSISDVIREMKVKVIPPETCKTQVEKFYNRNWLQLRDYQICGDESESEIRMCRGSAGSPLITTGKLEGDEVPYAFGLTSFGFTCHAATSLGIYTNVPSFLDWIEPTVWVKA